MAVECLQTDDYARTASGVGNECGNPRFIAGTRTPGMSKTLLEAGVAEPLLGVGGEAGQVLVPFEIVEFRGGGRALA